MYEGQAAKLGIVHAQKVSSFMLIQVIEFNEKIVEGPPQEEATPKKQIVPSVAQVNKSKTPGPLPSLARGPTRPPTAYAYVC
jgi:hypothetical protein